MSSKSCCIYVGSLESGEGSHGVASIAKSYMYIILVDSKDHAYK